MLEEFGMLIQQLRITRGLSIDEFARRAGVSVEAAEEFEHGRSQYTLVDLEAISRGLGMSKSAIFRMFDARDLAAEPSSGDRNF
jgi:transcriptional regulator with XRE-family HTH domain